MTCHILLHHVKAEVVSGESGPGVDKRLIKIDDDNSGTIIGAHFSSTKADGVVKMVMCDHPIILRLDLSKILPKVGVEPTRGLSPG